MYVGVVREWYCSACMGGMVVVRVVYMCVAVHTRTSTDTLCNETKDASASET